MRSALYVVIGVLVITAVAIAVTILREKRRARQMAELALTLGCSYTADGRGLLTEGLAALPVFAIAQLRGQSEIRNVLRKHVSGADLSICDYHYWTGGTGKNRFDHYQTVACYAVFILLSGAGIIGRLRISNAASGLFVGTLLR